MRSVKKKISVLVLFIIITTVFILSGCSQQDEFCNTWYSPSDRRNSNGMPMEKMITVKKEGKNYSIYEKYVVYSSKQECINRQEITKERIENNGAPFKSHVIPAYDVTILRRVIENKAPYDYERIEDKLVNSSTRMVTLELKKMDKITFLKVGSEHYKKYTDEISKNNKEADEKFFKNYITAAYSKKSGITLHNVTVRDATKQEILSMTPIETYPYSLIKQDKTKITNNEIKTITKGFKMYWFPSTECEDMGTVNEGDKLYYLATIDGNSGPYGFINEEMDFTISKRKVKISGGTGVPVKLVNRSDIGKRLLECNFIGDDKIYNRRFFSKDVKMIDGTWVQVSLNKTGVIGYVQAKYLDEDNLKAIKMIDKMDAFNKLPIYKWNQYQIVSNDAKMYSGPSEKTSLVGSLRTGDLITYVNTVSSEIIISGILNTDLDIKYSGKNVHLKKGLLVSAYGVSKNDNNLYDCTIPIDGKLCAVKIEKSKLDIITDKWYEVTVGDNNNKKQGYILAKHAEKMY